jgi:putative transposase
MSHSYISCLVHIVFSTAERQPLIRQEIQPRLHAYIGGIANQNELVALAVGGIADHVHVFFHSPGRSPSPRPPSFSKAARRSG